MGAGDLSAALWQERRHLELLLFRLETQRLHVEAGNLEWLGFTASDVERAVDRLRFEALARSVESAAVAAEWGLPAQATLIELISAAPAGPWPEVLHDHLNALGSLLRQLSDAARANEGTLRTLRLPAAPAHGPGPADTAGLLDQLTTAGNVERALAVTRRTAQPLLAQFLGGDRD
ncbi:flagellar export chaperone FlgN [Pseudarthrobacter sp. S9]|uniref:flagellar export chaperone FlgN n=1 Tax=Pseudarthrobacter sp. S9 TaxID=3418421 RepID=UPI003D064BAB